MEKSGDLSSKILKAYNTFSSIFIWKEGQSQISQGLFELFSNLQLISIVLSWQFYWQSVTTEGPINRFLKMVCQLLSFRGYFEPTTSHTSYDIAVNLITAYFAVVLLLVGFLAWRSYNQTKVRSRIKKFSIYLAELHHTVLFWMINSVFLALINDRISAAEGSKVIYQGTSMYIVIGIFMPINYIVGFWTASYCYDPFMSRNLFGKSGTTFQISTFWYKAILGFICGLIESEDYKWVFIAASLAITWIRYEVLLRNVYYFEFFTFKCVAILACLGVSFSIGTVILEIVTEYHSDIPWIYLVSLECFIAVLILIITNSRVNNIVIGAISSSSLSRMNHREPKQLRRSHQVYRRLVALSSVYSSAGSSQGLLNKSQNINSDLLYLMGHIGRHKQGDCEYSDCLCKQNEHKGMFGNQDLGDAGLIYAQCEALQTAIANIKDNVQYKIMLISLQCQRKELFARALANIYSLHSMKMTQRQRMLASYICRKLESEFRKFFERSKDEQQAKEENIVDIKRIVDFNTDSEALLKLLEKNSEGYISVWNYYCENEVVLSELLKQMSDHECQAIEVEKRWNSITQRFPNYSLQLYPTYYTYQSLVRNTPMLAEKKILNVYYRRLKMKAFDFNNKIINHIQNNNKENIIFYISVAKESLGKIIYTSNSVHKALGWPQADTIGQNISSFMAPFLGKVYHHRLQYYIEKDTNIVKACRKGFNRTRDGYLFPVYVYITLYPYLNAQPMFFLICSPRVLMSEVLIMSEDGEIDCFTWGIAQRLTF